MPFTFVAFIVGSLSLTGIPPFSGFFSKDSILAAALAQRLVRRAALGAGMAGAFLTGLYAVRGCCSSSSGASRRHSSAST